MYQNVSGCKDIFHPFNIMIGKREQVIIWGRTAELIMEKKSWSFLRWKVTEEMAHAFQRNSV